MIRRLLIGALLLPSALRLPHSAFALDAGGVHWGEQSTEHFDVRYRSDWMPGGLVFTLEGAHQKLAFNLGILDPALFQERQKYVLYHDRNEYLKGPFKPPPWSQAIAYPDLHVLVMYEMPDGEEFRTTMAHEMTHLIFGSYFKANGKHPPRWLDEGLAQMMEEQVSQAAQPDYYWRASRLLLPRSAVIRSPEFLTTEPKADSDKEWVRNWYFQSYLMTRWLFVEHSKLQFKSFCDALRSGEDVRYALQKVYAIADLAAFDKAWIAYAALGHGRKGHKRAPGEPGKEFHFKPVDFADFSNAIYQKKEAAGD